MKLVDVLVDLEGVSLSSSFGIELNAALGTILEDLDFRRTILEGNALLGWLADDSSLSFLLSHVFSVDLLVKELGF